MSVPEKILVEKDEPFDGVQDKFWIEKSPGAIATRWLTSSEWRAHWDFIRLGLNIVRLKCPHQWIPEDIFLLLKSGEARVLYGHGDLGLRGFLVLTINEHLDGKIAYIWAFYVNRPIKYELLEAPWASVVEELKKLGCIRIVMQTSRRAWERQAQKFGFHQTMLTYERDI